MRLTDPESFYHYIHITPQCSNAHVNLVAQATKIRHPGPPGVRQAVTIRYPTTGDP